MLYFLLVMLYLAAGLATINLMNELLQKHRQEEIDMGAAWFGLLCWPAFWIAVIFVTIGTMIKDIVE